MYSIVEIQGHQHKVKAGDILDVDRLDAELGQELTFDQVLFVGGENMQLGMPLVEGAKVKGRVIRIDRDKKVLIVKRKPGKYTKRRGFRRDYTGLLITELVDGKGATSQIDETSERAKKYLSAEKAEKPAKATKKVSSKKK